MVLYVTSDNAYSFHTISSLVYVLAVVVMNDPLVIRRHRLWAISLIQTGAFKT